MKKGQTESPAAQLRKLHEQMEKIKDPKCAKYKKLERKAAPLKKLVRPFIYGE